MGVEVAIVIQEEITMPYCTGTLWFEFKPNLNLYLYLKFSPDPDQTKTKIRTKFLVQLELVQVLDGSNLNLTYTCAMHF